VVVSRFLALSASLAFLASLGYFIYAYALFGTPAGPWQSGAWMGVAQNVAMFAVFAAHHSVIARQGTKQSLRRIVPPHLERAGYVGGSAVLFAITLSLWQPIPGVAWRLTGAGFIVGEVICLTGVVLIGLTVATLDVPAYLGLRQGLGMAAAEKDELTTHGPYTLVRNPGYLGWILLVWTLPVMTGTRLVFATISTLYIFLVIPYEERSFRRKYGAAYEAYTKTVRWRVIPGIY